MTDPDVKLARDVLTETLHGPVPMRTVARLAEAVTRLHEAAQWRPLTSDPKTWPENGQLVAVVDAEKKWAIPDANANAAYWSPRVAANGWTHWLPLPEPPKGGSDG